MYFKKPMVDWTRNGRFLGTVLLTILLWFGVSSCMDILVNMAFPSNRWIRLLIYLTLVIVLSSFIIFLGPSW